MVAARRRAQAEFAEWVAVLCFRDEQNRAVDSHDVAPVAKELGRQFVTLEIAQTLHITEQQVLRIVRQGEAVRGRTPQVWAAFEAGDIDARRIDLIACAVEKLQTARATEALDANVVDYAMAHTPGELRSWLNRMRAKLEPDAAAAEAEQSAEGRQVDVSHNDDGTSWLVARLPTHVAIAIGQRLRRAAKALPSHDPETGERDARTREQKKADLLAHWLTSCTGTETEIHAEIAISIDAADLAGYANGPGITRDGDQPIPAEWVRELAASETTLFRRLILDPAGRVLDTTSLGYQPPDSLRQALHWRDGTCRVAGCRAPVHETDLDHEIPFDRGGTTSAANLRCLCRRHHNMKSHGHLTEDFLDDALRIRERWHAPDSRVYVLDLVPAG